MTGHGIGVQLRTGPLVRIAVVVALVAAFFVVAQPAQGVPVPGVVDFVTGTSPAPEGTTPHTVEVVLNIGPGNTLDADLSVDVAVAPSPGNATGGVDYTYATTTVPFGLGDPDGTTKSVDIIIDDDALNEPPETIELVLQNPVGSGGLGTQLTHTVTINDNDGAPTVSIANGSATEGSPVSLDVKLSAASGQVVSVDYETFEGSATLADLDYSDTSGTLTFNPGDLIQQVTVPTGDDNKDESDEDFTVGLSVPVNTSVNGGPATGTILDNDSVGVTIVESGGSTAVTEGTGNDSYTVVLDSEPTGTVTVTVAPDAQVTVDKLTLTFLTSNWFSPQTVTVTAFDDDVAEGSHTGTVTHSASGGGYGAVSIASVVASIFDNDAAGVTVVESAGSTAVTEGTGNDSYTVVLDSQPTGTVTVSVTPDAQVTVDKPTLTFTTANWPTPQTVTVTAVDDPVVEGLHPGTVLHSASGGGYGAVVIDSVVASITDNDFSVAFSAATTSPPPIEGNASTSPTTVTVVLNTAGRTLTTAATVDVARTSGTATPGVDYTFTSPTTVTFPIGSLDGATQTVTVNVIGDVLNEANETVVLSLQNASPGGTIVAPVVHTLTILDDDGPPGLSVIDATPAAEGSTGVKFTVSLLPASGQIVTVDYATANGTALAGVDYTPTTGTLNFPVGITSRVVTVPITNDSLDEVTETLFLNLSGATNAAIADAQGRGLILDNDNVAPSITSIQTTNSAGDPGFEFSTGETVKVPVEFSDPGPADAHTVTLDWGDGTPAVPFPISPVGGRTFERVHTYSSEGFYQISVTVADGDGGSVTATRFVTVTGESVSGADAVGLVDPTTGKWRLFNTAGVMVTEFVYGNPGDVPIMGDWDGDGIDTPGLYRQSDGFVYLRNSNTQGNADIRFFFGNPGDVPLAGDFNGDGFDTVSIYRPSNQTFFIINKLGANNGGLGPADFSYVFGNPGDKPFVGDFNGDGIETAGLHRESTGLVYYRNSHSQGNADNQFIFGDPGDQLVAGDWTGDGIDSPGLYRTSDRWFYYKFTNTQGNADGGFYTSLAGWIPVAGKTGV